MSLFFLPDTHPLHPEPYNLFPVICNLHPDT